MLEPREQWRLFDLFTLVANQPQIEPDLRLKKGNDLVLVRVFDSTLVHYWIDHAVARVLIVDFEIVQEPSD